MSESNRRGPVTLLNLIEQQVIAPPLEIEATYKGQRFVASIEPNGAVLFDGEQFETLSGAASRVYAKAMNAGGVNTPRGMVYAYKAVNGWVFWHFRNERGELHPVGDLRARLG